MTGTIDRLPDSELQAIGHRAVTPLNDDGYRSWYAKDVNALLTELMALRVDRERIRITLATNPPLRNEDTTGLEPLALIDKLLRIVQQASEGVWQRAEVKRIKGSIDTLTQERDDLAKQLADAQQRSAEQTTYIASLGDMVATAASEAANRQAGWDNERARLIARMDGFQAEIADLKGQLHEAVLTARTDTMGMAQEFDRREAAVRAEADRMVATARGEVDEARRVAQGWQTQMQRAEQRLSEVYELLEKARGLAG